MEGTHFIQLNVPDHLTECILRVEDFSIYNTILPFTAPTLQVQVPGFDYAVEFNLTTTPTLDKNFVMNIDACMLGLQTTNCGFKKEALPDGVYNITYSVAPNQILNHTVNHLRTTTIENQLLCLYKELNSGPCEPSNELNRQMDLLGVIDGYIKTAKALAFFDNDCHNAMMMYDYAKKLIDKMNCKTC